MLSLFDLNHNFWYVEWTYFSRIPRPITSYNNVTKPFPVLVWIVSLSTIFILALLTFIFHTVYTKSLLSYMKLAKQEKHRLNFFIFPFAKFSEPEPLPWFNKWSAGKFLTFTWSILTLFLIFFYVSNLRAYILLIEYEKPADTLMDIYERGARVYIPDAAFPYR